MKKILFLTLLAFSSLSFATRIQISGLEKISSPVASMKYILKTNKIVECNRYSNYFCEATDLILVGGVGSVNKWIADFNAEFEYRSMPQGESSVTLTFKNYPNVCHIDLSNRKWEVVQVSINDDGSCSTS